MPKPTATTKNNKKPPSLTFASAFEKAKKRKLDGPPAVDASSGASTINNNSRPQKKKKKRPPKKRPGEQGSTGSGKKRLSQAALDLSDQLKQLSQRKQLAEALELYWNNSNDDIRDGFHACITIDCCARCGAMEEVDKILDGLAATGQTISIETNTSAMKGYAHGGNILKAYTIFEGMCHQLDASLKPNVRTLNTLLRGCLWTAGTADADGRLSGGVISSEAAWELYKTHGAKQKVDNNQSTDDNEQAIDDTNDNDKALVDLSSYEYSITLLCQALRLDQGEARIHEMMETYHVKTTKTGGFSLKLDGGGDSSTVFESLAVAYLGLARGKAVLGNKEGALKAAKLARNALEASRNTNEEVAPSSSRTAGGRVLGGEKRAWKAKNDDRRQTSNDTFRKHRKNEIEAELTALLEVCSAPSFPPAKDLLATRLVIGLFYFSGGGTTKLKDAANKKKSDATSKSTVGRMLRRHVINSSWLSFGLESILKQGEFNLTLPTDFIRIKDADRIFRIVGNTTKTIQDDGIIDFSKVFKKAQPIVLELGSGHGDWINGQAELMPERNHVAIELRADRVHNIFAKGVLRKEGPLENLCVVGDDCGGFLADRVKPKSVSYIFANHPEPPTQVTGKFQDEVQAIMDGGVEPAHMLNSTILIAAGKCLLEDSSSEKGRIVIVTDNMNYARLLCATVVKVSRQGGSRLRSCKIDCKRAGLREVETFALSDAKQNSERVVILEGQLGAAIGHADLKQKNGSSYFDRLWKTGASVHASSRERYILVLEQSICNL